MPKRPAQHAPDQPIDDELAQNHRSADARCAETVRLPLGNPGSDPIRRRTWMVSLNASYTDPATAKSRELDIHAIRAFQAGPRERDYLFPILIVECVNNPQPLVFFAQRPELEFLRIKAVKISGLPNMVWPTGGTWKKFEQLKKFLGMEKWHHYCSGRVSTQFCSFTPKKGGGDSWMASHEDAHFDAFKKLCDATDYWRREHLNGWHLTKNEEVNLQIYYPILVVQGSLLEVQGGRSDLKLYPRRRIQFSRTVAEGGREREYIVDVVQEEALGAFLTLLRREGERMSKLLRDRHKVVRAAVNRVSARGSALRSREKIWDLLDEGELRSY